MTPNARNLQLLLGNVSEVVATCLLHQLSETQRQDSIKLFLPLFIDDDSPLGDFIKSRQLSFEEYFVLALALLPHINPVLLQDEIKIRVSKKENWAELGLVSDANENYFSASAETFLFLLAGRDVTLRVHLSLLFSLSHWFSQEGVLHLEKVPPGEPRYSGRLILADEYIDLFTTGHQTANDQIPSNFPARPITTQQNWDELILPPATLAQIGELKTWVEHGQTLLEDWGMARTLKPGYRALFYGPPGTGKTLTATLLGKHTGREVYRVDLSVIVSKYIGETEKNLARLFDYAQHREWILFFDEADALFGKRTTVQNAHDRYANQEVSFLLQRIENHPGLVILASNFKANLDEAFLRRFNAVVSFPAPGVNDRLRIWQQTFPPHVSVEDQAATLEKMARYELTGGDIINAVQYACLQALSRQDTTILEVDLLNGIRREVEKKGKVFK